LVDKRKGGKRKALFFYSNMSPIPIPDGRSVAAMAGSVAARLVQRADTVKFGEQFAWPPNQKSMAFWIAIFIIAPVIFIMVGWLVWECKYGNNDKDAVKAALKEKRNQAKKKPTPPKIHGRR
jgi:hypothetical protein